MLQYRSPVNSNLGGNEDVDYGDGGDDVMNFEPIKPYANPVERKKKKEMDFSKWAEKELGVNRTRTVRETMEASTRKNGSNKLHPQPKPLLGNLKTEQESVLGNLTEQEFVLGKNDMQIQAGPSPKSLADNVQNEQVSMSLETQIDEENRARLQGMSADEIAEAQAEIMGRLDPALLNVLKRRGEEKLRKQRSPSSDNNEPKISPSSQSGMSHVDTTITSNHTNTAEENGLEQNSGQASLSLWTAWRERVEAARELRFSLDGTVILNGSHQIPKSSKLYYSFI